MRYALILLTLLCVGCAIEPEPVYDPNAPELGFLEATDPNWARDYGDTEDTRRLFNISVNRVRMLRTEKITAMIAKRLIALEAWKESAYVDVNDLDFGRGYREYLKTLDPNEVVE